MKKLIKTILVSLFIISATSCGSTPVSPEEKVTAPEVAETVEVDDAEYERSTHKMNGNAVSKDQFAKDKNEILRKIEELQVIMNKKDFESWLNYIAPESKEFYSNPQKLSSNTKILINNGLEDYFLNIFIPARKKSVIQEIRYESPTSIRAVQITGPNKVRTYYDFVKIDDEWFVELPKDILVNN